jgi:uncharacterized membrane protein YebE (DUF533 family)
MHPDFLIDGVLRSVLGGGRKRSRRALRYLRHGHGSFWTHPTTLLTAAGLAWGVYDTLSNKTQDGSQWGGGSAPGPAGGPPPASPGPSAPLPPPPDLGGTAVPAAPVDAEALRLVQLAISAANADGAMTEQERAAVVQQAQAAGVGEVVDRELDQRRPLADLIAGVTDPAQRATLYVLAFTVVRADEQVSGAERIYLAQLAHLLGLDPATVQRLETDTSERIDAQGETER